MKTILLMVHDDPGQEARLQCALDIARATNGHLLCLDLVRIPVVVDAYGAGIGAQATVLTVERDREDRNIHRLQQRLEGEGVSHEWQRAQGDFGHSLAEAARLVDLVVMSSKGAPGLIDQGDLPGRVAQSVTAPILVVPPEQRGFDIGGRAIVGWNGSATAATSIRAALPLLKRAGSVEILTIEGGDTPANPDHAARYLARHGCQVTAEVVARTGDSGRAVSTQLRDALFAADWGVIGSYGHGRLRERLFGGTTWTLIEETPVPLVIAH
ncbi:universal stress protein [Sphingobium sufflavum]|uniref:universal stress protein n=1 Tax=Sphingobium sufflavum TaxID=1129547 RepID=UPI001F1EEB64|nr:universal stress protein [Sphingobium sufflavum]MCE7795759.1 universal stress protein [Sphingobium sufflavum]